MIAIILILIMIIYWYIATKNRLLITLEKVNNAKAQIAAQTESRWDSISTLIGATNKYAKEESEVLKDITRNRSGLSRSSNTTDIMEDDVLFEKAMSSINVAVENYPELKSSNLYKATMDSINDHENNVRHSRMIFNDTVTKFNNSIIVFPTSLVAQMNNFNKVEYFDVSEDKKEMPTWE